MGLGATWWFVSDLHLDPDGADPRGTDGALGDFVDSVVLDSGAPGRRLVLLGDTFDLAKAHVGSGKIGHRIRETVAGFPTAFDGLRRCLADGVEVHFVCGNHDYPLMSPHHRAELSRSLAVSPVNPGALPRFHSWLLHEPGLFYAEHGNQHDELSRLPLLLTAARAGGVESLPATPLQALADARHVDSSSWRKAAVLAGSIAGMVRSERRSRSPEYGALLAEQAVAGLSTPVVHALHEVSRASALGTVARIGRRVRQRRPGVADYDGYLRLAARRIDDILTTDGPRPLCYVFGHSHVATLEELPVRGAWYAGTGTWSHRHHRRGDNKNPRQFPFVVISTSPAGRQVALRHWDADTRGVVSSSTPAGSCRGLPAWVGIAGEGTRP
jgi:hypothetical protein